MIIAGRKKAAPRKTRSTGMPVTELRTKATPPIGGVSSPIIRLKMMIDPNCSGSIPNSHRHRQQDRRDDQQRRRRLEKHAADEQQDVHDQQEDERVVGEPQQGLRHGLRNLLARQDPAEQRGRADDEHDLAGDDRRVAEDEGDVAHAHRPVGQRQQQHVQRADAGGLGRA